MVIFMTKNGVSSFWLGPLTTWQFTEESTKDMIVITKVIRSLEQMVRSLDSNRKLHVRLASDRSMSSEWSNHKIVLPSDYLWMQGSFPNFSHIVDFWVAIALHEAAHIVLSGDLDKAKLHASHEFLVTHIIEDYWVEQWVIQRFPGYLAYFKRFKEYHFMEDPDLGDDVVSKKINDFLYLINVPAYKPLYKESQQAYRMLVSDWEKAKESGQVETWDRIDLGRQIFRMLFPNGIVDEISRWTEIKFSKPLDIEPSAPSSQQKDSSTSFLSPFLLTGKIKTQQLIRYHQEVKSGQKISWASEQMMDSWLQDDGGFKQQSAKNSNQTIIKRPDLDAEAVEAYRASYHRVKPYILKLRRKFEKANTSQVHESVRLYQGMLDEEALYRASFSRDLFKVEEERRDLLDKWDLTLLIDQSQSTERLYNEKQPFLTRRYEVAVDLAVLFVEAFEQFKPIELRIYAYSTALNSSMLQLDELYLPGMKKKERLGMIRPKYATPEYLAIKEMTLKVNDEGRANARKLFLVLSDGQPDDYQFGGGEQHKGQIREWINKWSRKGFSFAHIALADDTKGKDIYPESIHFEQDYARLITKVYRWISNTISPS